LLPLFTGHDRWRNETDPLRERRYHPWPGSPRDSQSAMFLTTPGTDWLYSGVANGQPVATSRCSSQVDDPWRVDVGAFQVLVEHRDSLQAFEQVNSDPFGNNLRCRTKQRLVARVPAQATANGQDAQWARPLAGTGRALQTPHPGSLAVNSSASVKNRAMASAAGAIR
jgi:hypothetical protein